MLLRCFYWICITDGAAHKQLSKPLNKLPWPIRIPHSEHCIFVWTFFICTCRSFTSVAQCGHIFFSFEWVIRCLPKFRVYERMIRKLSKRHLHLQIFPIDLTVPKKTSKKGRILNQKRSIFPDFLWADLCWNTGCPSD